MTEAAGRAAARPRPRFTARAAVLAVVVVALLFYLLVPLKAYLAQRSSLDRLDHQVAQLQQHNARLEAQVRRLNDPRYVEQRARECLGMVKPGEVRFSIPPRHAAPKPPAC